MEPNPRFWAGKRVCVTGGTGMLGFQLVEQLLGLGAHVRVLALPPTTAHPIHARRTVTKFFGDVRDPDTVRAATEDCPVVFHTAGVVAVWKSALAYMQSVHVDGTRTLLENVESDARVVHTSSIVTIGASRRPDLLTEDSPFDLHDLRVDYVHAKRASEQVALNAAGDGQDVVITNPAYLVGPEDHGRSVMGRFCVRFWKGRILLIPPGGFSLVDVRDVARGQLLAAEHGQPGRRYVLGGENHTFHTFLSLLAEAAGLSPRLLPPVPWWTLSALAGLSECRAKLTSKEPYPSFQHVCLNRYYWFYRSDRAADELGYRYRPLADCLEDTYRWYVNNGALGLRGLNKWLMRPADSLDQAA
ncbi:MAG TPA: NAD-dependent epimerase/dehydratase family protein [Isosphaeraceae bacterium]|jgi:dihydroflavonol-4-reductase|nr:NAD-dependent epimerase/dehydratase family protein [Isosphaeraceae bacterium]